VYVTRNKQMLVMHSMSTTVNGIVLYTKRAQLPAHAMRRRQI
jgi:hypothetical protein